MKRMHLLIGMALGAGVMYLLDPDRGRRRRAGLRDRGIHAAHALEERGAGAVRHLRNRARGAAAETRARLTEGEVDDRVLEERVRAAVGRTVSSPGSLEVSAREGRVTLAGQVAEEEVPRLVATARAVRGVAEVESRLAFHAPAG